MLRFVQFLEMAEDKTTSLPSLNPWTPLPRRPKALIYNILVLLYRKGEKNNTSYTAHVQIPAYMS